MELKSIVGTWAKCSVNVHILHAQCAFLLFDRVSCSLGAYLCDTVSRKSRKGRRRGKGTVVLVPSAVLSAPTACNA